MRVKAIGVKRMAGQAKETGRPFDFTQLTILKPIEVTATERFQLQGYGFETSDIDVDNAALPAFAGFSWPCELDLTVETMPGRRGLRSVITGAKPVQLRAAA